jgi:hypothetical protein
LIGNSFALVQRVADDDRYSNTVDSYWEYDKSSRKMTFRLRSYLSDLYIKYQSKKVGQYTGHNAFGVKARITAYADTEAKLSVLGTKPDWDAITITVDAPPSEGRRLAKDVVLMVTGVVAPDSEGHVTNCENSHDGATIDDPVEVATYTCSVNGIIGHVEFYDTGTHKTLTEWSAPASAVKAK